MNIRYATLRGYDVNADQYGAGIAGSLAAGGGGSNNISDIAIADSFQVDGTSSPPNAIGEFVNDQAFNLNITDRVF